MIATLAGVATVFVLGVWHVRTRRRESWSLSPDGRFYIGLGYPMVAIAVYWLIESPTATDWEWALGNLWALFAMVAFVLGFNALNDVPKRHEEASQSIETISNPERARTKARSRRNQVRN